MKDINLLPEEIKTQERVTKSSSAGISPKAVIITVFVLILIGISILVPNLYVTSIEAQVEAVQSEIESAKYGEINKVKAELMSINAVITSKKQVIGAIDSETHSVSQMLNVILQAIPEGISIYSVSYDGKGLSITGQTPNDIMTAEFYSNIQKIDFIASLDKGLTSRIQGYGQEGVFEAKFSLVEGRSQ